MPVDEFDRKNGPGRGSDDPDQSSAVPKIFLGHQDDYATDLETVVEGTPLKQSTSRKGFRLPLICSDTLFLAKPPCPTQSAKVSEIKWIYSVLHNQGLFLKPSFKDETGKKDITLFRFPAPV